MSLDNHSSDNLQRISKLWNRFRTGGDGGIWWTTFSVIVCLSLATRLHRIELPDHVAWDETHFGKMAGWYINRTYFFDVHPPTGKLLLAAFGHLTGYDASHPFEKPGQKYNDTNYLGMRVGCAVMGAALVPMSFVTVWELTYSMPAATLAAANLLFDTGYVTLSQYILLDPILMFFIMAAALGQAKVYNHRSFSARWWFWLTFTGAMLAGAVSVKFVGLFVVALVGLGAVQDLWTVFGDTARPLSLTLYHFLARALCLILLPAVLYALSYGVHFAVLSKAGSGDMMYSSAFQAGLEDNFLYNVSMPREVCYGAGVTLKQYRTGGLYLHSHEDLYPPEVGPVQQQVTTYGNKDHNNIWLVKKWNQDIPEDIMDPEFAVEVVRSGDLIRLEHEPTGRNLHSHRHPAPLTRTHYQVSGYGEDGLGDSNDIWRIELVNGQPGDPIHALSGLFRLVHYMTGCALHSYKQVLPKWGSDQNEVTCSANKDASNTLWNIEENFFERLPNVSTTEHRLGFWSRFVEAHAVQFDGNSGFKPKKGEITSRPWQWPLNYQGQWFSVGSSEDRTPGPHKELETRVYFLGNPVIWWSNLFYLLLFCTRGLWRAGADWRLASPSSEEEEGTFSSGGRWLLLAWALHYLPFFCMGRVLYYHHYFPAQLFASMLAGLETARLLEVLAAKLEKVTAAAWQLVFVGYLLMLAVSFTMFSPLVYGMSGPDQREPGHRYGHLLWLTSWEF